MTEHATGPGVIARYSKAIGSGVGHALVYLVGVMSGDEGFGDVSTVQWLGTLLAFLVGAGIVAVIPKGDEVLRQDSRGRLRAGPAARLTTDSAVGAGVRTDELV